MKAITKTHEFVTTINVCALLKIVGKSAMKEIKHEHGSSLLKRISGLIILISSTGTCDNFIDNILDFGSRIDS